ncbi:MAG: hypothetical protein KDA24_07065 [Deltaproteobacteria bacterium]|nr:hypothetical protein [Deltaproteobacteria bacterium]
MTRSLLLLAASGLLFTGCDLDGSELLQSFDPETGESLPVTVVDLDRVDEPPTVCSQEDVNDGDCETYLGAVGPSDLGTGQLSGATFTFDGTGGRVCVLIDPQSVWRDDRVLEPSGNPVTNPFMDDYPFDDGDLDLLTGLASYYTGTPGDTMGDFVNDFVDDNGVSRRVDLNLCLQDDTHGQTGGTSGRATPEMCSFQTLENTPYRIALYAFSVPVDDNELKYALQVREGNCPVQIDECTLRGDRDRAPEGALPFGLDNVEEMYCEGFPEE